MTSHLHVSSRGWIRVPAEEYVIYFPLTDQSNSSQQFIEVWYKHRLDDGSRSLRDLFHRGNRWASHSTYRRPEREARGRLHFGFQGEINPVVCMYRPTSCRLRCLYHTLRSYLSFSRLPVTETGPQLFSCLKPAVSPFPPSNKARTRARHYELVLVWKFVSTLQFTIFKLQLLTLQILGYGHWLRATIEVSA